MLRTVALWHSAGGGDYAAIPTMENDAWSTWQHLRERFGDPVDASSLSVEERREVMRENRALRIRISRDGFGSGNVFISWMPLEPAPADGDGVFWVDVYYERPALVTDEEFASLKDNSWDSLNDMPGLPRARK
jgi:hypothetical protein